MYSSCNSDLVPVPTSTSSSQQELMSLEPEWTNDQHSLMAGHHCNSTMQLTNNVYIHSVPKLSSPLIHFDAVLKLRFGMRRSLLAFHSIISHCTARNAALGKAERHERAESTHPDCTSGTNLTNVLSTEQSRSGVPCSSTSLINVLSTEQSRSGVPCSSTSLCQGQRRLL